MNANKIKNNRHSFSEKWGGGGGNKISFPVDGKSIIFNEVKWGDDFLFLYGKNIQRGPAFLSFIKTALDNGEFCLYAFDPKNNKLRLESNGDLELFPINSVHAQIAKLNNKIYSMMRLKKPVRILIDFGSLANKNNIGNIIFCEELIQKMIVESKRRWSRLKYKRRLISKSVIALTAFNIGSLENGSIKKLMDIHKKVVFSTENESIALLPNFSTTNSIGNGSLDAIPFEAMEQIVKANLEIIILSMVSEKPTSGFNVVKKISQQYHTVISQGTIYPILYSLKERGLLNVEIFAGKEKIYSLTEEGKKIVEEKLSSFRKAQEYMINLMPPPRTIKNIKQK